jgi:hypothetical protein
MTEAEWKIFRRLCDVALDRFCQRVLGEITKLSTQPGKSNHERYLAVYKRLQRRDRELADAFNDPRRSTALRQLARICDLELLTEEEFGQFEPNTRSAVQLLLGK